MPCNSIGNVNLPCCDRKGIDDDYEGGWLKYHLKLAVAHMCTSVLLESVKLSNGGGPLKNLTVSKFPTKTLEKYKKVKFPIL